MTSATTSPLQRLSALGQSVWVDFLSRSSIHGGHLQQLIDERAVVGATSNPAIFQKAMTHGDAYDEQLRALTRPATDGPEFTAKDVFWAMASQDIQDACDLFSPVWDGGHGRDGYVSLEVDPGLAYDSLRTYREAAHLHDLIDRPNLLVKIPATKPGLAAIEDAIAHGISINVTLIFSLQRYAEVAESYIRGLERLVAEGQDPAPIASVASFFISRIDVETDRRLDQVGGHEHLKGKLAIANARLAYQCYKQMFSGPAGNTSPAKARPPNECFGHQLRPKTPTTPTPSMSSN